MLARLGGIFDDSASDTRRNIIGISAFLFALNGAAWALAFLVFSSRPMLLGTALIAYTFGLRHAVDADHISAIDNVTRKLMQEGRRPTAVGLFFSLGHSTIVIALSVAIALAAATVKQAVPWLQNAGGPIGTLLSALFLFAIAIVNMVVLAGIVRAFKAVRRGERMREEQVLSVIPQAGLLGRLLRPMLRTVDRSWKMYPVGLFFGLGFDTATEVALLGIAAIEAARGLPLMAVLVFPLLFTAGMSLLDTADGILMLGAYGWAFVRPVRRLYYNMNITLVSALVALLVGAIETLSVISVQLRPTGVFWTWIAHVSGNFQILGFVIAGILLASWGVSAAIYRFRRYDELDVQFAND